MAEAAAPPGLVDVAPVVLELAWSASSRRGGNWYWYGLSLLDLAALAATCRGLRQAVDTFAGRQTELSQKRFQDCRVVPVRDSASRWVGLADTSTHWRGLDEVLKWVSRKMPALRTLDLEQPSGRKIGGPVRVPGDPDGPFSRPRRQTDFSPGLLPFFFIKRQSRGDQVANALTGPFPGPPK